MNPFAIDYFYTLLFDSYQDALTQSDGKPMKRKHFENIMEATVKEARLYIAKHELARIEQLTKR